MNYTHFIGIDVSKNWLDFTIMHDSQVLKYDRIENSLSAIKDFFKGLKKVRSFRLEHSLVCMEHTGIYNNHLLVYLTKLKANICLESGMHIKQSSGLKRGKNDKVDSQRIAMYAYKNRDEIKLWEPKRDVLVGLKYLTTLRNRIINVLKQLKTPLKETISFVSKAEQKKITDHCESSIAALKNDLVRINKEIESIIMADDELVPFQTKVY